jgi:hypothetical protein
LRRSIQSSPLTSRLDSIRITGPHRARVKMDDYHGTSCQSILFSLHCATNSLAYSSLDHFLFEVLTYCDVTSHTIHCESVRFTTLNFVTPGAELIRVYTRGFIKSNPWAQRYGFVPLPVGGTGSAGKGTVLSQSTCTHTLPYPCFTLGFRHLGDHRTDLSKCGKVTLTIPLVHMG